MHPGVLAGEKNLPIESVALYVPRGKGSFPSVAMMTSIPAVIAGVNTPVIFTPPEEDGTVDCATLVAAEIAGVKNVFKIGGAQAVAAAAFGTETVPKCLKIVGPGSPWVAAAKSRLSHVIDTGTPAGPSEAIVFADQSANGKLVALDLLIEAEHGSDSSVYLISNSITVIQEAKDFIPQCFQNMTQERVKYATDVLCGRRGGIIQVDNTDQALDFINLYAPEHLQIHSKNPDQYLDNIKNSGEIMLGEFSPMSIANFSLGPNNVIPTNAWAKTKSPLSVHDFIKSTSIGKIDNKGFAKLSPTQKNLQSMKGLTPTRMLFANEIRCIKKINMEAVRLYKKNLIKVENIPFENFLKDDQVLVEIAYAGICGSDLHNYKTGCWISRSPSTPGHEFSGKILKIGKKVNSLKVNDHVIADSRVFLKIVTIVKNLYHLCLNLGFVGELNDGGFAKFSIQKKSNY